MGESQDDIICDSSSLIALTDTCFLPALSVLSNHLNGNFIIPQSVEDECVNTPVNNKNYALNALRIKHAIDRGVIRVCAIDASQGAREIMGVANGIFYLSGKPLALIQLGESEILALCGSFGIKNVLIDERTTRLLIESPLSLKDHFEEEFGRSIGVNEENLRKFESMTKGLSLFRSSEILITAYEKGYFSSLDKLQVRTLEAALYSLKFSGCSISFEEISDFLATIR
ncbi:MAG: hypothetical protein WC506_03825 [Candidatus Micrarchaeia archaeon]